MISRMMREIPHRRFNPLTREWVLVGFVESPEAFQNAEIGYVGQTGTVHAPWLTLI